MANKLCAGDCGRVVTNRARCVVCEQEWQRSRNARRTQYQGDWPAQARAQIAEYRALHGDMCPGWQRTPHEICPADWTCDHDVGPLCRPCNSRKGATVDRARSSRRRR